MALDADKALLVPARIEDDALAVPRGRAAPAFGMASALRQANW